MPDHSNGSAICSWDDWKNNLSEEQRQYEIWRCLYDVQRKYSKLERRKLTDKTMSFLGGFVGGVVAATLALRFMA